VLKRIFGPERDEVVRGWREFHNVKVRKLHFSANKIKMIKSRRVRWAGHVARMGIRGINVGVWWESQIERDH
jgi:hypothetical protein